MNEIIQKNSIIFFGAAGMRTTFGLIPTEAVKAAINNPVYRLYNRYTGELFYTTSYYKAICDYKAEWKIEGTGWYSPTDGIAVYRIFNPRVKGGDHYYTKSLYEGKPIFYSGGDYSVYVSYNPYAQSGTHNYTASNFEQNNLLKMIWKYGV